MEPAAMNIGCSVTEPMGAKSRGINRNRNSRPGTASAQRWTPAAAGLPRIGGGTARVESPGRVDPQPPGLFLFGRTSEPQWRRVYTEFFGFRDRRNVGQQKAHDGVAVGGNSHEPHHHFCCRNCCTGSYLNGG